MAVDRGLYLHIFTVKPPNAPGSGAGVGVGRGAAGCSSGEGKDSSPKTCSLDPIKLRDFHLDWVRLDCVDEHEASP